jgi:hypothetical protein
VTYLNLVNNVLRRMREDEVSTWNETEYSKMLGDFVNDAMSLCQSAHNWSALFTEIDINTVDGQQEYTLDGLGQMGQVYTAYNDTENSQLCQWPLKHMMLQTDLASGAAGGPAKYYSFKDVSATDDDPDILVWPIPNSVQTLTFHVKKEQGPMSADATELLIPEQPVIQYALAYAKEERGELGGNSPVVAFEKAKVTLSSYIALDAERHPEINTWVVQ